MHGDLVATLPRCGSAPRPALSCLTLSRNCDERERDQKTKGMRRCDEGRDAGSAGQLLSER